MSLSPVRRLAAALAFGALVSLTACGLDVQTMQPYTPAEGVQADVTPANDPQAAVKIRNLLIVVRRTGRGIPVRQHDHPGQGCADRRLRGRHQGRTVPPGRPSSPA